MRSLAAALLVLSSAALAEDGSLRPVRIVGVPRLFDTKPAAVAALDPLTAIGTLPQSGYDAVVFADTDHDGQTECFVDSPSGTLILEWEAGQFVQRGFIPGIYAFAAGDLDQDGKADLVCQFGRFVSVYEAVNSSSFPSVLVWQSPPLTNIVGYPTISDTDGDGRMEIVHTRNAGDSQLLIYECLADNTYGLRYVAPIEHQEVGRKLIADLNQDGLPDIATCGSDGYVRVLEANGDDNWRVIFADSTGYYNAYGVTGGVDTDGDGRPELFVSADHLTLPLRHTLIYQANSTGQLENIATITLASTGLNETNGIAQLEPGGPWLFLWLQIEPQKRIQVYRSLAPGAWTLESEYIDPTGQRAWIHSFDSNRNGRDEIYWMSSCCSSTPSWILERPTTPTDTRLPDVQPLTVTPTPATTRCNVVFPAGLARQAHAWTAYDVAGRQVFRELTRGRSTLPFDTRSLGAGLYLLSITDVKNRQISSGKLIVVRGDVYRGP